MYILYLLNPKISVFSISPSTHCSSLATARCGKSWGVLGVPARTHTYKQTPADGGTLPLSARLPGPHSSVDPLLLLVVESLLLHTHRASFRLGTSELAHPDHLSPSPGTRLCEAHLQGLSAGKPVASSWKTHKITSYIVGVSYWLPLHAVTPHVKFN